MKNILNILLANNFKPIGYSKFGEDSIIIFKFEKDSNECFSFYIKNEDLFGILKNNIYFYTVDEFLEKKEYFQNENNIIVRIIWL